MKDRTKTAKLQMVLAMLIFGTIGIFRRNIALPSAVIACVRGLAGSLFLFLFVKLRGGKLSRDAIRRNLKRLVLSGALIGFNWIFLFEAYRYTSVAIATLCYYMAPVLVILLSPFLFKERLGIGKGICVLTALTGMFFVSGVIGGGMPQSGEMKGILLGLAAAVLYAVVVVLNKQIREIGAFDKTIVQLLTAGAVLIPYLLVTEDFSAFALTPETFLLLLTVSVVHTGISYALYFGSMTYLKAQTIALFSYIDPITAILLSALLLHEELSLYGLIGAVLVLGSTIASELLQLRKKSEAEK